MPSSNKGIVTVLLRNTDNQRLRDIRALVEFYRADGRKLQGFVRHFEKHREDFRLDAFPSSPKRLDVKPVRYRRVGRFFQVKAGQRLMLDVPCLRDPGSGWKTRFTHWRDLTSDYGDLRQMLGNSSNVEFRVRHPRQSTPLGRFAERAYDDVDDDHLIEGKAGLLNLYAKMFASRVNGVRGRPWLKGIEEVVRIQRDRVVALISEKTANLIRTLEQQNGSVDKHYRGDRSNLDGHRKNIPERFQIEEMHSVKTRDQIGVLQLTVAFARERGQKRFVLDADIDERGNLLLHFGDFLRHRITRTGTHPYEVYDLLRLSIEKPILGYQLV